MNWIGGARKRVKRRHFGNTIHKQPFNVNHVSNRPYQVPEEMKVTYKSRPRTKQPRYNTTVSQDLVGLQALNSVHKPENSMKVTNIDSSTNGPNHHDIELPLLSPLSPSALDFLESNDNTFYGGDYPRISTLKRDNTLNADFNFTFDSGDNSTSVLNPYPRDSRGFEMMNKVVDRSTNCSIPVIQKPTSKLFQTFDSCKSIPPKPKPFEMELTSSSSTHSTLSQSVPPNPPEPHPPLSILKAPARPKPPSNESFTSYMNTTIDTERPYPSSNTFRPTEPRSYDRNNRNWYEKRNCQIPHDNMKPLYSSNTESFNNPLNLQGLKLFHKSQTTNNTHSDASAAVVVDSEYKDNPKTIPNMSGRLHSKHSTVEDTPTVAITKPHPFSSKATPSTDVSQVLSNKGTKTLSAFEKMILNLEGEHHSCQPCDPPPNDNTANGNDVEWMEFINKRDEVILVPSSPPPNPDQVSSQFIVTDNSTGVATIPTSSSCYEGVVVSIDDSMYPVDQEIVLSQDEDICWTRPITKRKSVGLQSVPILLSPCEGELPRANTSSSVHMTSSPGHMTTHVTPPHSTCGDNLLMKTLPIIKRDTSMQTEVNVIDCSVQVTPPTISIGVQATPTILHCDVAVGAHVSTNDVLIQTDDHCWLDFKGLESQEKLDVAQKFSDNNSLILSLIGGNCPPMEVMEKIRILQEENQQLLNHLTNDLTYHCILSKLEDSSTE